MKILVLNAGSSSQKSCLYEITGDRLPDEPPEMLWEAAVDWTHHQGMADIKVKTSTGEVLQEELPTPSRPQIMTHLLETLWQGKTAVIDHLSEITAVGHRVVHGGQEYRETVKVTDAVKAAIGRLTILAPVHNPANLEGIEAVERILGIEVPQFAVFDTAFHSSLPDAAAIYPGPYQWVEQGANQCGTCRFGEDPNTSVLDPNCRAHDVDNLYVVDGSFFPSNAAVSPALTIMANALRVGDRLIERLK
jgi:acetate kinase